MKRAEFPQPVPAPSAAARRLRGGVPVGRVEELEPAEAVALSYLRMWFQGARAEISQDFVALLNEEDGAMAMEGFDKLCRMVGKPARPFLHHAPGCACYGGDESAFLQMIGAAAEGDEDGATAFALHLFAGHPPRQILGLAARSGLAFAHMALRLTPRPSTLH